MRISGRVFNPKAWAILLYVAVLSCMLSLGKWQLDRAALKISMQEKVAAATASDAAALQSIDDVAAAASVYQRVQLTGHYDANRQFLWDNRTHKGRAGFEVISVVHLTNGGMGLVNRGWVPAGPDRQTFPDISFSEPVISTMIDIQGMVSRPSKGFASGEPITGGEGWPRLIQFFDYVAIGEALGEPIIPAVVQVQTLGTDASTASVLTSRSEWFTANWQPAASGPAKHYSYAFQWFAMALALTVIFVVVNTRRITPATPGREHST